MTQWQLRILLTTGMLVAVPAVFAVPIPIERKEGVVTDPAGFMPNRKHMPLPGTIIAVLLADAQPLLNAEGRHGPAEQLCVGWNGGSYRWVYLPCDDEATINRLSIPLPDNKSKVYPKLNMANPTTVKPWGIDAAYSLVEVEVNDGLGSPEHDSFVATKIKKLDGSTAYPIQTERVVADLKKQYEAHLSEMGKDLDEAMTRAAAQAIKGGEPTGPREKNTLMFVTWLAETEKLQVRFLTRITDGSYKYARGINIELSPAPAPPAPPQGGELPPSRWANGLRYGAQFGIEYGVEYQVSKAGKIEGKKTLAARSFQKEIPAPPK